MDWLTFIAEIIKAAAWPIAAVAIALIFREQLRALLSRIRKGKVGPAEFEFEQEVRVLAEGAPDALPAPSAVSAPVVSLATTNPRAAILEAWLGVDSSAQRLAFRDNKLVPRNPVSTARLLDKHQLLEHQDIALFNDLRALRSQATHDIDFSPSPESVIQYVQLAHGLKERIDRASAGR